SYFCAPLFLLHYCYNSVFLGFLFFFSGGGGDSMRSFGTIGRVSNLIDSESAIQRSRSVVVSFRHSWFVGERDCGGPDPPAPEKRIKPWFWSMFRTHKKKKKSKEEEEEEEGREDKEAKRNEFGSQDDYSHRVMMRSRSVYVAVASDLVSGDARDA
ncbi:hypothetical protein U1Q18_018120, partial [Sarracenia purpurea var. burkii]